MAFEKYETQRNHAGSKSLVPYVTIQPGNGNIYVNAAAIRKFDLYHVRRADLYWDTETQRIGIKLTKEGSFKCYREHKGRIQVDVCGKGFLKYYGITATGRFIDIHMEGDMLIIQL